MKKALLIVALFFPLLAVPAAAQSTSPAHAGVGVTFGVLGAGVEAGVPLGSRVNVRAGVSGLSLSRDFDADGIDLAATLSLKSVSAHLDLYPFGGGFHISPGVMLHNGNKMTATARVPAGETFDLGNETLISDPSNPVSGSAEVSWADKVAPSVRIGWGNIVPRGDKRWSIPVEFGIVYARAPQATLSLSGGACDLQGRACRTFASDASLQQSLREEEAELNDNVDILKIIPVFSVGFAFRF